VGKSTPEQLALARELHDGIAQDLVALGYSLDLLLANPEISDEVRIGIRNSRFQIDDLISKVRLEIFALRAGPSSITNDSIKRLTDELCPDMQCSIDILENSVSSDISSELTNITSEILRNITAHARATQVAIKIYLLNNKTCLEISDNGTGGAEVKDGHWGLVGIQERVQKMHGTLVLDIQHGTRITILI
jgi:signal transduction histidine kinase